MKGPGVEVADLQKHASAIARELSCAEAEPSLANKRQVHKKVVLPVRGQHVDYDTLEEVSLFAPNVF